MRKEKTPTKVYRLPVAVEHKVRVLAGDSPIGATVELACDVLMTIWCELHEDDPEPVPGVGGAAIKLLDALRERWGCDEDTVPKAWLENEHAYRIEQARHFDALLQSFTEAIDVARSELPSMPEPEETDDEARDQGV